MSAWVPVGSQEAITSARQMVLPVESHSHQEGGDGRAQPLPGGRRTFSLHFLMVDVSSLTTMSTHLILGSLSFCTCFFTVASKARSGVKRPVLHPRRRRRRRRGQGGKQPDGQRGGGWE